jgi:nitrile hydratase accessory protein
MTGSLDATMIGLPRDEDGPVFDQPWQAQAFSIALQLHKAGVFSWPQWVQVLSDEIRAAPAQAGEPANDAYWRQWMAALERITASSGLVGPEDLEERSEAWRRAYINTPHGQAVSLSHADCPPEDHHHHQPASMPIFVSPARGN